MNKVHWWHWPEQTDQRTAAFIGLLATCVAHWWSFKGGLLLVGAMYILVLINDYCGDRLEEQRRLYGYLAQSRGAEQHGTDGPK